MATSEAQKKATIKYQKTLTNISIRIKPEEKEKIDNAAQATGMSLRAFILEAIEEKIFNETLKGTFNQTAHPEEQQ